MNLRLRPSLAALFAMLLFLAACGSTTDTEETQAAAGGSAQSDDANSDSSDGAMDDDSMDHDSMDEMEHSHDHGSVLEVPEGMTVPTLSVEAAVDPVSGVNVFIDLNDFEIAPESASTEPVDGEGHLHLYVDGTRVKRFYNQNLHLGDLEPGEREIMVEISSNNHAPYAVDGVAIQAATTITVPESSGGHDSDSDHGSDHSSDHGGELVESANPPSVTEVRVIKDPKSGWNVFADVVGLTFAAESAGLDHVDGEGHLHLYVDGKKVDRLYGPWTHISSLEAGTREIMVGVNANTHAGYDDGTGNPVMAMTTIEVDEADGSSMDDAAMSDDHGDDHGDSHGHSHHGTGEMLAIAPGDADVLVDASFLGGDVEVENRRVQVSEGQTVGIIFESDEIEQIHVHGYDLLVDVGPDEAGEVAFLADSKGTFEVELESSGRFLFEIQVS